MSKRTAYEAGIEDEAGIECLIESMNNSMILESSEYDILQTAFKSKITDRNIESIIRSSESRYIRYLHAEIFAGFKYIEMKINLYLQKFNNNSSRHLFIQFLEMKEIDELIVKAVEVIDNKKNFKRQKKENCTAIYSF